MHYGANDIVRFEAWARINRNAKNFKNIFRSLKLELQVGIVFLPSSLVTLRCLVAEGRTMEVEGRHNIIGFQIVNNFYKHGNKTIESTSWLAGGRSGEVRQRVISTVNNGVRIK